MASNIPTDVEMTDVQDGKKTGPFTQGSLMDRLLKATGGPLKDGGQSLGGLSRDLWIPPQGQRCEIPWQNCYVIIQIGSTNPQIICKRNLKDHALSPAIMQYILNNKFPELKDFLRKELQEHTSLRQIVNEIEYLRFTYKQANQTEDAEADLDEIVMTVQKFIKEENLLCFSPQSTVNTEEIISKASNKVAVYENDKSIYIVGTVEDLEAIVKEISDSEKVRKVYEKVVPQSSFQVQVFEVFRFRDYLKSQQIPVSVQIDMNTNTITFQGESLDVVKKARNMDKEFMKTVSHIDIHIEDPLTTQLLTLSHVKDVINEIMVKENQKIVWTVSESNFRITLYYKKGDDQVVETFKKVLKHKIAIKEYLLTSLSSQEAIAATDVFQNFVKEHNGKDLVFNAIDNEVRIALTKDVEYEINAIEAEYYKQEKAQVENTTLNISNSQSEKPKQEQGDNGKIEIESQADVHRYKLLEKLGFARYIQKKIPGMEIHFLREEIQFSGTCSKTVKGEISDFIQNLCHTRVSFPPCVLKFISEQLIANKIEDHFRQKHISCYWYVDKQSEVVDLYSNDSTHMRDAETVFITSIVKEEFSNLGDIKKFLEQPSVQSLLKDKKEYLRVTDTDREEFIVFGLAQTFAEFSQLFEKFLKEEKQKSSRQDINSTTIRKHLGIKEDVLKFLEKRKSSEWTDILKKYNVFVEVDSNGDVLLVGTIKDVDAAVSHFLATLKFERIKWSCDVMYPERVQQKLSKNKEVIDIEQKYNCSVDVMADSSFAEQHQICQWVEEGKAHVVLIHGNAYEIPADVLFIPFGDNFQLTRYGTTIMEKGGNAIKKDFELQKTPRMNEIFLSSQSGDLPCQTVAYCPIGTDKSGKVQRSELKECFWSLFKIAEKEQLQSLVIPLTIFDTIPETTFLHWFAEAYWQFYSQFKYLSQIYLCVWYSLKHELLVEVLNQTLPDTMDMYDFRNMISLRAGKTGNIQQSDITIHLVKGKLVEQKVDVLVNSSNQALDLKKGLVSASIDRFGGPAIQADCLRKYPKGIRYGQIAQTCAGNLNFKFILHSSLPHWTPDAKLSSQLLANLVYDCLDIAGKQGCRTMAFPVFGTGTLQYPWDEVARVMIDTIRQFGAMKGGQTSINEVTIVLYEKDDKSILAFERTKKQAERLILIKEDSEPPPKQILSTRVNNVRLQCLPIKDTSGHHCEAVVYFVTFEEIEKLRIRNPQNKLFIDEIITLRNESEGFWEITVYSDKEEKRFKDAVTRALEFAAKERIASIAYCMRAELGLKYKVQAILIRDTILTFKKKRYLHIVKVLHPGRGIFERMIDRTLKMQENESRWYSKILGENKHQWKCISHCDIVQSPRILITAVAESFQDYDNLKGDLEKVLQDMTMFVRSNINCGVLLKDEAQKAQTQEATNQQPLTYFLQEKQPMDKNIAMSTISKSEDAAGPLPAVEISEVELSSDMVNEMNKTQETSLQYQHRRFQRSVTKTQVIAPQKRPSRSERFFTAEQNTTKGAMPKVTESNEVSKRPLLPKEQPRSTMFHDERRSKEGTTIPTLWKNIEFNLEIQTPEDIIKSMPKVDISKDKLQFLIMEGLSIKKKFKEIFGDGTRIEAGVGSLKLIYTSTRNVTLERIKTEAKEIVKNLADDVLSMEISIDADNRLIFQTCLGILKAEKTSRATVLYDNSKFFVVGFRPDCDYLYSALERRGMNVASAKSDNDHLYTHIDGWVDINSQNSELKPPFDTKKGVVTSWGLKEIQNLLATTKIGGHTMPFNWEAMDRNETVKQIRLNSDTGFGKMEFDHVKQLFERSLPQARIVSIKRIQNIFNWEIYYLKKRNLERLYGHGCANELLLFHGTTPDKLDVITEQNLDPRLAGGCVGALLGKGTYFAVDSQYSDTYAQPDDNGHKFMFLVKVLAGKVCLGRPEYIRPPQIDPKDPKSCLFDSCVDNVKTPRIYCLYHNTQYYLSHLIEYS